MNEQNFFASPGDQLDAAFEGLKSSDTWSFHVFNSVTGSKNGYLEIAISKDPVYLKGWRNRVENYPERHVEVSIQHIVDSLSHLDIGAEIVLLDDRFMMIGGEDFKLFDYGDDTFVYIGLSVDRTVLIRHALDWDELEELYGSYLRPTKH